MHLSTTVTNNDCLDRAKERRILYRFMRKNKVVFFGQIMRAEPPENIMMTGNINGRRGRQRSCVG